MTDEERRRRRRGSFPIKARQMSSGQIGKVEEKENLLQLNPKRKFTGNGSVVISGGEIKNGRWRNSEIQLDFVIQH